MRFITFSMSCCISTAVCCALVTAIMSGIALGYNYSLAEYIDLKETNVSVYLKRGIFDDEIADDFSWRRAGHLPVAGHLNEDNLVTGAPADDNKGNQDMRSGRRGFDQSILDSDANNQFEGALLKLTTRGTKIAATIGTIGKQTVALPPSNLANFRKSENTIDQIKDFQSYVQNKPDVIKNPTATVSNDIKSIPLHPVGDVPNYPAQNMNEDKPSGRRANMMDYGMSDRFAVPLPGRRSGFQSALKPLDLFNRDEIDKGIDRKLLEPRPVVTRRPGPIIIQNPSSRIVYSSPPPPKMETSTVTTMQYSSIYLQSEVTEYSLEDLDLSNERHSLKMKQDTDDYIDDDIDKIPVRRKRDVVSVITGKRDFVSAITEHSESITGVEKDEVVTTIVN